MTLNSKTEPHRRQSIFRALQSQVVVMLLVLMLVGIAALVWNLSRLSSELVSSSTLRDAKRYSQALKEFRALYTSEVVSRLGTKGIEVTHDYSKREGAIPLPATLTKILAAEIGKHEKGAWVRLYSDYPFPWRKAGGPKDDFEREALRFLRENPKEAFVSFEQIAGRSSLRYATADLMRPACVECHNSHPDSPKTDWQIGDVRGVLEIVRPLASVREYQTGFRGTLAAMGSVIMFSLSGIGIALVRLRRNAKALQKANDQLEQRVAERTADLSKSNEELEKVNGVIRGHNDRMGQELDLGREIQMSMVPLIFPPFPEHDEFSIYAKLNPAREVGGDFYDFYFLDERRLLVCIGDVSDKGVPAALFMAVAKTVIKSQAASEQSVANILTQVNAELSQSNSSSMFVTIFIGILDIQTGELVYSNGGHNPPLLRREDASIERLSKVHGPIVGAREGLVYGESRLRMRPNDLLLLYTDGVTEATNAQGELFAEHRLEKVLSNSNSNMARASVDLVTARVEQFEKEVEQSDDITVLALHFVGAGSDGKAAPEVFRIRSNFDDMSIADDKLDAVAERHEIPADIVSKFKIILDELLSNIISYAYADDKDHEIELWMEVADRRFLLTITDDGIPFNPLTPETPYTNTPIEERELGGLGIHLVRTLADEATYQRQADKNVLTLVKEFAPSGG